MDTQTQDNQIVDPFSNVQYVGLPVPNNTTQQVFTDVQELQVGVNNTVFRAAKEGIWLGSKRSNQALFYVDMDGNLTIRSATSGARITLSSTNKTIIVNDGSNDRVLIGYQSGGF